ncbi:hypothetical protein AHAS_Ahas05G0224700 [Arachis hypogaea]|uniref:Protein FAR1-RELATED SEQUENCE n=1 Tax=Arachis hypogaea TaxID=3818 RepID=A0A445D2C7_ARAHY|nr:hypothetical protein Ahy_A05g023097 [Arachis hypogaea]
MNTLINFMHNLDRTLNEYRNNELVDNFKSQCSGPMMITFLEVYAKFATNCFTHDIFKKICNEIQKVGTLNIKLLSTVGDKADFSVIALEGPIKDLLMELHRCNNLFSCFCRLFESCGIFCNHIFCVMKYENLFDFQSF